MEKKQKISMFLSATLGSFLMVATSGAASSQLTCGDQRTIGDALRRLRPGGTLFVSGTCNENVVIEEQVQNVTFDGQGVATVSGPDTTAPTFSIRGRGITIKGFTITGGDSGITVTRSGNAIIDGNIIQTTGDNGITVTDHSSARVVNNTIQNNASNGVVVSQNSSARIGILIPDDPVASPNTIQGNGDSGVVVTRSSSAVIIGNRINNNVVDGVIAVRGSQADIASNDISGNGRHGIFINLNSVVNLGNDTGSGIEDLPNTSTVNNASFGLLCVTGGVADGRLGGLNGNNGPTSFGIGCINSLSP